MAKVVIMDHPLIQHKIGYIRRIETGTKDFRQTISEIAMLICYEATRSLPLADVQITTPICDTTVKELKGKKMAIVPILRAGLGMVDGVLNLIPAAKIGHIGLYRDPETHNQEGDRGKPVQGTWKRGQPFLGGGISHQERCGGIRQAVPRQSICVRRDKPYKRCGLFRVYPERIRPFRYQYGKKLQGPGGQGQGDSCKRCQAGRPSVLCQR